MVNGKNIAVLLVTRGAVDTRNAVVQMARERMTGQLRIDAVRAACRIQLVDRRHRPASIKEAGRN